GVALQVLDVVDGPRGEVVQEEDGVPPGEERLREVTAQEAGPAGDERLHREAPRPWGTSRRRFRRSSTASAARLAPRPSTSNRPRALISRRRAASASRPSTAEAISSSPTSVPSPRYSTVP